MLIYQTKLINDEEIQFEAKGRDWESFWDALLSNNLKKIKKIFDKEKNNNQLMASLLWNKQYGETCFHASMRLKDYNVFNFLLSELNYFANLYSVNESEILNIQESNSGNTVLHFAFLNIWRNKSIWEDDAALAEEHIQVPIKLILKGADLYIPNDNNVVAFEYLFQQEDYILVVDFLNEFKDQVKERFNEINQLIACCLVKILFRKLDQLDESKHLLVKNHKIKLGILSLVFSCKYVILDFYRKKYNGKREDWRNILAKDIKNIPDGIINIVSNDFPYRKLSLTARKIFNAKLVEEWNEIFREYIREFGNDYEEKLALNLAIQEELKRMLLWKGWLPFIVLMICFYFISVSSEIAVSANLCIFIGQISYGTKIFRDSPIPNFARGKEYAAFLKKLNKLLEDVLKNIRIQQDHVNPNMVFDTTISKEISVSIDKVRSLISSIEIEDEVVTPDKIIDISNQLEFMSRYVFEIYRLAPDFFMTDDNLEQHICLNAHAINSQRSCFANNKPISNFFYSKNGDNFLENKVNQSNNTYSVTISVDGSNNGEYDLEANRVADEEEVYDIDEEENNNGEQTRLILH